jgi:hypothetical protein
MNSYPVGQTAFCLHAWGIETDTKARLIHQKCTCGWKSRVREFHGALSIYDNAFNWASHFDVSKWSDR